MLEGSNPLRLRWPQAEADGVLRITGRLGHAEYQQIGPNMEMRVSAWYVDEFGNKTREVRARD